MAITYGTVKKNEFYPTCGKALEDFKNRPASELIYLRIKEHRAEHKQSFAKWTQHFAGVFWWTNGKINVRAKECPEGFVRGRSKRSV